MRRLIIIAATAAATTIPAVVGLTGNPALSHRVPVQARSQTIAVQQATQHPTTATTSRTAEPGDDKGTHSEPGDDRGQHSEPGNDRGGHGHGGHGGDDGPGHH